MSYPPQSYPQAPPPGPPGERRLRGRIPLILATVFGVLGVALGIVGIVLLLQTPIAKVGDFPRAALDGQPHQVQLTRTGNYVGYYEEPTLDTSLKRTPTFRVRITGPDGVQVAVSRYSSNTTLSYDIGEHHGLAAAKFRIAKAGTYTVQSDGRVAQDAELALGESIFSGFAAPVLLFVAGLFLVIAAVVLLIVGLVKRSRHKREIASTYGGGYPHGGYPGGQPGGGYRPPPYPPPAS